MLHLRALAASCVSIRVASGGRYLVTSGKRVSGTGRVFAARSEACIHTLPESVVNLITWRPRCSEEAAVPLSGQTTVNGAAVSTRGRLLYATTDWRLLCRPISSIPAVRQLSAGKSVGRSDSSPGLPKGEDGGKLRERASCAEKRTGEATYAGESARTRWSCGGSGRPPNFQARRSHGRAHWQKETALWSRWGAHRERVEADAWSALWSGREEDE
jgi:hypothetical protein